MFRSFRKSLALLLCTLALAAGPAMARDISFDLQDDKGRVTQDSYPGKYLLLSIGFTSCPDICPTTLYEYAGVMQSLKNPDAIQPIFVTVDPRVDDPARLNAYTRHFDERIVGLSGEMDNIKALVKQLGATFGYRMDGRKVENPEAGDGYTVYHSALIYLVSPERKLVDVYDYQIGADNLTAELDKVLGAPDGQGGESGASAPADAPSANGAAVPAAGAEAAAAPGEKTKDR